MTPEQLKASILQYAIQGKLVEQRPEEGTAEDLYKSIQEEKQKLIKEGKIKKEKPLAEITEDEMLFDIPDNWKWVRIGDIYALTMGQSPDGKSVSKGIDGMEFHQGKVFFGEDFIQKSDQVTSEPSKIAEPNSVLLCVRAPVGIVNITDRELCIGRGLCAVKPLAGMTEKYALYSLRCLKDEFIKKATGTTFVAITGEVVKNQLIPLPPLAEQHRIVAKIEELLPFVDRYAASYEKLEQFNAKFPEDMKKSILQYAIQGKLVEQRPEEGTAEELYKVIQEEKQKLIKEGKIKKEKPLDAIAEDDIPFDIPNTWKWCYLGEIFTHTAGKALNAKNTTGEKHKYITTSNVYWDHFELDNLKEMYYTEDEIEKYSVQYGDLLVLEGGDVGRTAIWDLHISYCIQNHIHRLRPYIEVNIKYFYYVMMYLKFRGNIAGKGIGIKGLSANALHCIIIPLPPLEEQHRIVAKIEEMLPYCDRLIK